MTDFLDDAFTPGEGVAIGNWFLPNEDANTVGEPAGEAVLDPLNESPIIVVIGKTVTVTYRANGGVGEPSIQSYLAGTHYTFWDVGDAAFLWEGHTFLGWCADPGGAGDLLMPGRSHVLTDDLTLYAQWRDDRGAEIIRQTVTYHPNGGRGDVVSIEVEEGAHHTILDGDELSYNGCEDGFLCWNTQADAKGRFVEAGEVVEITGALNLYAVWHSLKDDTGLLLYQVEYDPGDGTGGEILFELAAYNHRVRSAEEVEVSRPGYSFVCWSTSRTGAGNLYWPDDILPRLAYGGNVTLYAQWSGAGSASALTGTVTYDPGGGSGGATRTGAIGSTHRVYGEAEAHIEREGYQFSGWNTEPDGTGQAYASGDSLAVPGEGITLYAQWIQEEPSIPTPDIGSGPYAGQRETSSPAHPGGDAAVPDAQMPAPAGGGSQAGAAVSVDNVPLPGEMRDEPIPCTGRLCRAYVRAKLPVPLMVAGLVLRVKRGQVRRAGESKHPL